MSRGLTVFEFFELYQKHNFPDIDVFPDGDFTFCNLSDCDKCNLQSECNDSDYFGMASVEDEPKILLPKIKEKYPEYFI